MLKLKNLQDEQNEGYSIFHIYVIHLLFSYSILKSFMSCFTLILQYFQSLDSGKCYQLFLSVFRGINSSINKGQVILATQFLKLIIKHIFFMWKRELSQEKTAN